ncbi:MAG: rhodanese-like domain-containing protein [Gammaproteobacteria bacterium]|nr:rhodanese-like domain-containing protein [Gammaproteobacteria bacterium]
MKFKLFLLIIFLSTVFSSAHVLAEVGNLSNEQMKQLMAENVPLIDIRRPEEWKSTGVIGGSKLITFFDSRGNFNLEKWLAELDKVAGKNDKLILICRSGNRTGQVAQYLDKKLGYKQVYHLKNGIKKWIKADEKVVSAK